MPGYDATEKQHAMNVYEHIAHETSQHEQSRGLMLHMRKEVLAENSIDLLHKRLGHVSNQAIGNMIRHRCAKGSPVMMQVPEHKCDICMQAKYARPPFDEHEGSAQYPLNLVHADVMGPFQTIGMGGSKYALVIIDDYTKYVNASCLESKADVADALISAVVYWQTQLDRKLKILRTDRGTEFCNKTIDAFCSLHGIQHQLSAAYTPQQNGVERVNRTLMDKVRAMKTACGAPNELWSELLMTACRITNVVPPIRRDKTPHELFWSVAPDISGLRIFGCKAYVQIPPHQRQKIDPRSRIGTLVGYSLTSKAYRVLIADDKGHIDVVESRNVSFDEQVTEPFMNAATSDDDLDSLFPGLGGDGVPHPSETTLSTADEAAQEAAQALLHDEHQPKNAHDEDEDEEDDESASTQAHAETGGVRRDGENEGASCASTDVSFFMSMWLMGTCTISIPRSTRASRVWSPRRLRGIRDTAQSAVTRTGTEPSRRFWHVCVAAQGFRIAHACGSRDAMRCMSS